ncbi:hypothetical protein [Streptomyces diastatochromogenes]|nr:hypothetical protein [Streptomyces diastatochromogenes]MCZ0984657.1 hypothetical protein [Streptomyces diastatochromogenes]
MACLRMHTARRPDDPRLLRLLRLLARMAQHIVIWTAA